MLAFFLWYGVRFLPFVTEPDLGIGSLEDASAMCLAASPVL